jgi:hypothetical protein
MKEYSKMNGERTMPTAMLPTMYVAKSSTIDCNHNKILTIVKADYYGI